MLDLEKEAVVVKKFEGDVCLFPLILSFSVARGSWC